jgi:pimeloyl-ACP methyl ester carboxylesterase
MNSHRFGSRFSASQFLTGMVVLALAFLPAAMRAQATKPTVVATTPPNGAQDVPRNLAEVTFTFSKPMRSSVSMGSSNFGPVACSWSADKQTLTARRTDLSGFLSSSAAVTFTLNKPPNQVMADLDGNLLDTFVLSFKVVSALEKIPADVTKGFHWPYYLVVPPAGLRQPGILLVRPNNTGSPSENWNVHDDAARSLADGTTYFAEKLQCALLVPTFPRPNDLTVGYTHALDRAALQTTFPGLERIDLQLIAMIDDALARIRARGLAITDGVWLWGASASGSFVSRFTMLHPERVRAAAIGCPGFGPIVPVSSWGGRVLNYPVGVADLEILTGRKFNEAAFKKVALTVWVGDEDTNIVPWFHPDVDPECALLEELWGGPELYHRWPGYEGAYTSVSGLSEFRMFPGLGHAEPPRDFFESFFDRNRTDPLPAPRPKPIQYAIYFPHIACVAPWTTEVALLNTKMGADVMGQLHAFDPQGHELGSVPLTIPSGGRVQMTINTLFPESPGVAYLVYRSDSGFVGGYSRFYEPLNRVAIPASSGARQGWFPKKESNGWTGIAFVNIEPGAATVALTAIDNSGAEVAMVTFALGPGIKVVGMDDEVFGRDVSRATYFRYTSNRKLLGFTVNGSPDGQQMDGMAAVAEYLK